MSEDRALQLQLATSFLAHYRIVGDVPPSEIYSVAITAKAHVENLLAIIAEMDADDPDDPMPWLTRLSR